MLEILLNVLRDTILITGLVVVMMMLIESFNVESRGKAFAFLRRSRFAQILFSASLGAVPGCVGGFASVSLYTHRMIGFGALLAMMIATVGDEAFLMLALFPAKASLLFAILFALGIGAGWVATLLSRKDMTLPTRLEDAYDLHVPDGHRPEHAAVRHFGWKRVVLFLGVAVFICALMLGMLEKEEPQPDGLNIFSEQWMYWLFGALSLFVLATLLFASDHFVDEHLWAHIVGHHLAPIFLWTFFVLLVVAALFSAFDLRSWIGDNPVLMILLAMLVGLIPESGPHMVFVTLFAGGVIPFPVLLANSIVQDGHASLPLLADSKASWLRAKALKAALALPVSLLALVLMSEVVQP